MTVYVDDARNRYGRMVMCHMGADTADELHAFAAAIGCRRAWFHRDHYDLPLFRRRRALRLGAVAVSSREMVRILRRRERPPAADEARAAGVAARLLERALPDAPALPEGGYKGPAKDPPASISPATAAPRMAAPGVAACDDCYARSPEIVALFVERGVAFQRVRCRSCRRTWRRRTVGGGA